jgi:predicted metal-dependent hydrolase
MIERSQRESTQGFERRDFSADRVRPRRTSFVFPEDTPRYWVNGNPARTHLMNALHLFLPPFERMITQVVRHGALPRVSDPVLLEQARGFMAQESIHGRCHELFLDNLRAQGYSIDRYGALLEWVFGDLIQKKLGTRLSLSVVSAFEHYTDLLVPLALQGDFLDGCDAALRELLEWHAAEEIEHNAVAFALLQEIAPGKVLRVVGSALALGLLQATLVAGACLLLWQDRKLTERASLAELFDFFVGKYRVVQDAMRLFFDYARADYHPSDADFSDLARAVLSPPSSLQAPLAGAQPSLSAT